MHMHSMRLKLEMAFAPSPVGGFGGGKLVKEPLDKNHVEVVTHNPTQGKKTKHISGKWEQKA